jgi:hypothetical protein
LIRSGAEHGHQKSDDPLGSRKHDYYSWTSSTPDASLGDAMKNPYCEMLGIEVPTLEQVVGRRLLVGGQPTVFGLLVVALLERGQPMTLEAVAERLDRAGVGPADEVLRSLKRCRPARDPVHRDGDEYGLDPHSHELDMLAFIYGLRPPKVGSGRPERPDPAELAARLREAERRRDQHAAELAALRRAIIHVFPVEEPAAATLIDVDTGEIATSTGDEITAIRDRLGAYDVLVGVEIRAVLRALAVAPGERRLADLSPPQKTISVDGGRRSVRLTTAMLVQGSCGISRPFGGGDRMRDLVARGQKSALCRRLEADAGSLFALYQYGRTHGAVRVRWGAIDDMLPVPWVHADEHILHHVVQKAFAIGAEIEAVVGRAPERSDPWARARLLRVTTGRHEHDLVLIDQDGTAVDDRDVQLARLAVSIH